MLGDTSKFKVRDIVYNDGKFAIARGLWEDEAGLRLACRWHESDGIGYPQTFGKPQWMLFPNEHMAVEVISNLNPDDSRVVITLG